MDKKLKEIKERALQAGACALIRDVHDYAGLVALFFSPQGLEFADDCGFPQLDDLRLISDELLREGVYVDRGDIELSCTKDVCVACDTRAIINVSGVDYIHNIVVMHGASAEINADNYAVIVVTDVNAGNIKINKDNTVIVL